MKVLAVFSSILLAACAAIQSDNPGSLSFSIAKDSILALNRALQISTSETHATIQDSKQIEDRERDDYRVNCRLDFKKFGARTIKPQNFTVTRTEDGTNWISQPVILRFYTEIYLSSDKGTDVIKMVCQRYGDQTDYHFTVADMQEQLGDVITFEYNTNK